MDNINEKIAEVMGWISGDNHDDIFPMKYWKTVAGIIMFEKKDWHPDTDLKQAMMCAFRVKSKQLFTEIDIGHGSLRIYNMATASQVYKEYETIDDLPLAICEAICEAILETK